MADVKPKIVGRQSWRNLLFVHWRVAPANLQLLLPDGMKIETFDGSAWLGLVPFSMERVRPWWSPPVPGISWFLETNVRTYVRDASGQTGVWFLSLDANHRLAVTIARSFWHLNYIYASLEMKVEGDRVTYSGTRGQKPGQYSISANIDSSSVSATAATGTLDEFLLERYHLFAQRPDGRFLLGQVHHEPYKFQQVVNSSISQSMTTAQGCPIMLGDPPDHIVYSKGVDVGVSPLQLH